MRDSNLRARRRPPGGASACCVRRARADRGAQRSLTPARSSRSRSNRKASPSGSRCFRVRSASEPIAYQHDRDRDREQQREAFRSSAPSQTVRSGRAADPANKTAPTGSTSFDRFPVEPDRAQPGEAASGTRQANTRAGAPSRLRPDRCASARRSPVGSTLTQPRSASHTSDHACASDWRTVTNPSTGLSSPP